MTRGRFTVVGGGPVGSLLAIVLGRHGYEVGLYEGRPDSRLTSIYQGKSINIALSDRGWRALEQIGVSSDTKADAIPMYQRAIHGVNGELSALPYGTGVAGSGGFVPVLEGGGVPAIGRTVSVDASSWVGTMSRSS